MPQVLDISGHTFGRWTALERHGKHWLCRCACGREKRVYGPSLRSGVSLSCGCLRGEALADYNRTRQSPLITHGMYRTRTYCSWSCMIKRCTNPNTVGYENYGGRGISVCDRWLKFENFFADMGERPQGRSIDRIDNNGNYTPDNCRWATRREQVLNRRPHHHQTMLS